MTMLSLDGPSGAWTFAPLAVGIISIALYFLPTYIGRKKRNFNAIFTLNFLLGWTVVGWIVALVWATTIDPPIAPAAVVAAPTSVLCSGCGKYSAGGSRFCASCGGAI